MKKTIGIVVALALISSSAWASKARMMALGQDEDRGSSYIDDGRNVFANPAYVGSMGSHVITEWGAEDEGGFFRKQRRGMSYGLYLGGDVSGNSDIYSGGTINGMIAQVATDDFTQEPAVVHVFLTGDMGFDWGVRIGYGSAAMGKGVNEETGSHMSLGAGIMHGDLEVALDMLVGEELEGAGTNKWEGGGMFLDVRYPFGKGTAFFRHKSKDGEATGTAGGSAGGTDNGKYEMTMMELGYGMVKNMSSSSMFFTDIMYKMMEESSSAGSTKDMKESTSIPVTVGFETKALSWLKLRGSVTQTLPFGASSKESMSLAAPVTVNQEGSGANMASTMVRAGATLKFGKLMIDGSLGMVSAGDLNPGSDLLSNVAVTYKF